MENLRKFYAIVNSKKYNNLSKEFYIDYLQKIREIMAPHIDDNKTFLKLLFEKTNNLNLEERYSDSVLSWGLFILPKNSNLINLPTHVSGFVKKFGINAFVDALQKIVDEYDGKTKTVS